MQTTIDTFYKLKDDLDKILLSNQGLLNGMGETINVRSYENRAALIEQLTEISNLVTNLNDRISNTLNKAQSVHSQETITIDNLINKKHTPQQPWTAVTKKKQTPSISLVKQIDNSDTSQIQLVNITKNLSLKAIVVGSFDDVKACGQLYYIKSADHFALKINDFMFHGNIGILYTDEKNPEKIKDCRFANNCMKSNKCDYYHDPLRFPGSKDYRNYIAGSFLYTPQSGIYKNKERSRRFGSREHLDTDIQRIQDDEIARFNDQVFHDILCAMLLHQK